MKLSQTGINLIKTFEGFRGEAYLDQAGIPTIGYGSTLVNGVKVKIGDTITKENAEKQLAFDVSTFELVVNKYVTFPGLTQNMFDALVSIIYNVGVGIPKVRSGIIFLSDGSHSTLLKKLNAGDKIGAAAEFLKWVRAGGQVSSGLERRRKAEKDLFLTN